MTGPTGWLGRARRPLAPRWVATTAHLGALSPLVVDPPMAIDGVVMGTDVLAGGAAFRFDLFAAVHAGVVAAPNAMISGAAAHGKSALAKTYVARSSRLAGPGGSSRFCAVIDPKGEWVALARALGWSVVALAPGGPTRVNPIDIVAVRGAGRAPAQAMWATQTLAVGALLATVLRRPSGHLEPGEERVLAYVMTRFARKTSLRAPTLADLRAALAGLDATDAEALDLAPLEVAGRIRPLLDALALLVDYTLAGMFDGASTVSLDWEHAPGLVVDLSALLDQPMALRLALVAVRGWLQGVMYRMTQRYKLFVIDEAWRALDDQGAVRFFQEAFRLGRQFGAGNVLITHAVGDLSSQVDDGAVEAKLAQGLLATIPVRIYGRQQPEQAQVLTERFGLGAAEVALLARLGPGQALWTLGQRRALVRHVMGAHEVPWCDTNGALGAPSASRPA